MQKQAAALGSALPDVQKSEAAALPTSPVVVGNKAAPGQTGPRGLSPRTTYSRVNTGAAPAPQIGSEAKATPPRGLEFLPTKVAHKEISMASMMRRPLLQDLVKQAMEGTASKVDITAEAARQLGHPVVQHSAQKTASAPASQHVPSEVCEKYAVALEHLAKTAAIQLSGGTTAGVGPGEGPNAIGVMAAQSSESNIDAGQGGQAVPKNVPPQNPPQTSFSDSNSPPNAMQTNIDMEHGEQPVDPMGNEHASNAPQKQAAAKLSQKNLQHVFKLAGVKPQVKTAGLLQKNLAVLGLKKTAEDAINPAQISAGAATAQGAEAPEGVSAAEEAPIPPEPSDVSSQKRLIASNEAAINYTKREAKADPKSDMNKLLAEPALSAAHDSTLQRVWDHTEEAGAKIAAVKLTKTAAAHALLLKLAQEQAEGEKKEKKKEKASQMGGLSTPAGQSNFNAANMGGGV